jgi:hypothetical protein
MLGAMLAVREGTHFTVDVFPRLSPRAEAAVELLSGAFVVLFALVFLWWGWEFTEFAIYRISELAELPLWLIHMAWPIAGLVWLMFQTERMADAVQVLRGGAARRLMGGNVLSPGGAAQILFGLFFLMLVLRVPVAVALGLACLPILLVEPRLRP